MVEELWMIEEHLAQAERHVLEGTRHLIDQRDILAELERDGHDTAMARELLSTFEASLALHVIDRDRLLGEKREAMEVEKQVAKRKR